jgi:hypothetical protein
MRWRIEAWDRRPHRRTCRVRRQNAVAAKEKPRARGPGLDG